MNMIVPPSVEVAEVLLPWIVLANMVLKPQLLVKEIRGNLNNITAFLRKSLCMEWSIAESIHKYGPDRYSQVLTTNLITQHFVRIVKFILTVLARLTMEASSATVDGLKDVLSLLMLILSVLMANWSVLSILWLRLSHPHIPTIPGAELGW